jgi:hypothetical protein
MCLTSLVHSRSKPRFSDPNVASRFLSCKRHTWHGQRSMIASTSPAASARAPSANGAFPKETSHARQSPTPNSSTERKKRTNCAVGPRPSRPPAVASSASRLRPPALRNRSSVLPAPVRPDTVLSVSETRVIQDGMRQKGMSATEEYVCHVKDIRHEEVNKVNDGLRFSMGATDCCDQLAVLVSSS